MQRHDVACWALDVASVRALIAAAAAGTARADWAETLLVGLRIADVNQHTVHFVGPYAGRARMIGRAVATFWPRESRAALADLIVAVVAEGRAGASASRAITSVAFVDPVLRVWSAADGARPDIVYVALSGTPVDDRSLWALRASEERYRNLIHHLPIALLQVDSTPMTAIFNKLRLEGITDIAPYLEATPELPLHSRSIVQVTDANRKAMQLFGADRLDQMIGSVDFLFVASPDTAKRVITAHFDGRRSYTERMKLRTFDGRMRDVELSVTYPTPPERLDVTLLSLEDLTDRLRTEVQLHELQADYTRAARISMLGELATSIAHEVNQPLSAIVTNAETSLRWLARAEPNLAKVGQLTARIAESARRASDIVQRIRGMAARREPERVLLDLNVIVEEALLFVRYEIESRAIDLSVALARDLPPVLGDRVQLQQVIVNLLVNAVQALAQGSGAGRIEVGTATGADGAVVFTIHDDGPGIADEDLDRIFGSFFTTKEEGIGIGLALCQSIIAAHGGTITASNHAQGGAIFQFSLSAS
jgi:C4-dicarboxylate-specific signal transduction histidine kinase